MIRRKKTDNPFGGKITTPSPSWLSSPDAGLPDAADTTIKLEDIVQPQQQPRRYFDPQALQELVSSVKQHGILQPLLVRPVAGGKYELVAGERRYRAAQAIKLEVVPVVVRELSDEQAFQLALIENLQREDLNPIEETEGILHLLAIHLECDLEAVKSLLYRMKNAHSKGEQQSKSSSDESRRNVSPNLEQETESADHISPNSDKQIESRRNVSPNLEQETESADHISPNSDKQIESRRNVSPNLEQETESADHISPNSDKQIESRRNVSPNLEQETESADHISPNSDKHTESRRNVSPNLEQETESADHISPNSDKHTESRRNVSPKPDESQSKMVQEVFESLGLMNWLSFTTKRLPLLNLPEEILMALRSGKLEYTKAQALARVNDDELRKKLLSEVIANDWSLSQIKEQIQARTSAEQPPSPLTSNQIPERLKNITQRIKKRQLWKEPTKQKQLVNLLNKLEALLGDE